MNDQKTPYPPENPPPYTYSNPGSGFQPPPPAPPPPGGRDPVTGQPVQGQTVVVVNQTVGFGSTPVQIACPSCHKQIITSVTSSPSSSAWLLCSLLFCLGYEKIGKL